jgi:hypothetical protein
MGNAIRWHGQVLYGGRSWRRTTMEALCFEQYSTVPTVPKSACWDEICVHDRSAMK